MERVAGKIAIVTGGAQGLGEAAVQRLTQEGALVVLSDTNAEAGSDTAAKYGAEFFHHDVREEDQWTALTTDVLAKHGKLDILVNNAGIFSSDKVDETPLEDFRRVIDINLIGSFLGCKHGVRAMKRNAGGIGGSIINLSSIAGLRGAMGSAAYGSSKAAVALLTKTVAVENAAYKIRCNSIHPGIMHTPMFEAMLDVTGDKAVADAIETRFKRQTPMGNIGEADDIGNMVLFLASSESKYITGTEMVVDGGAISGLPF
jgi:NAD(P)-dependent dehydrogenase (short-subunit alcohol dehydrogenase family)